VPVSPRLALRRTLTLGVVLLAFLLTLLPDTGTARAQSTELGARAGFSPGGAWPWLPDAELARELDLMAASGAGWVRVDFTWASIEHVRGTYSWSNLDRVVRAVHSRGMKVLALPAYTPGWARPAGGTSYTPPADPAAFAAFTAAAAARYVPQGVLHYEIWNEPNLASFWAPKPDAAAYARLLQATTTAVRAAAPDAVILSGGLSPAVDAADGSQIDPVTFLNKLYALGVKDAFDAVGVHPYSFPAMPSDVSTASWNTFQKMSRMRDTMVANGDSAKKIWLTETGAPTGSHPTAVSESAQAAIVTDTLRSAEALSWAGPVFFYAARDLGTDPTDREQNFGLLRRDFSPKPGWAALVESLRPSSTPATTEPTTEPTTAPTTAPATTEKPGRPMKRRTIAVSPRRTFGPKVPTGGSYFGG
jgi:hypothetical protein